MVKNLTLFSLAWLLASSSCATVSQREQVFYNNLVLCTKTDAANAALSQAVLTCAASAIAGDYAACIGATVPALTWSVEELECLATSYSTKM